jgi:hypothetical protein
MKEQIIDCSARIVLQCPRCGERLVLLGEPTDWYVENRITFTCECGEALTFTDRFEEDELEAGSLGTS